MFFDRGGSIAGRREEAWPRERLHHMGVALLLVEQIGGEQDDGNGAGIFPPMLGWRQLGGGLARLVHDRHCACAGVFHDLTRNDVDDRRAVAVAVPWHDRSEE